MRGSYGGRAGDYTQYARISASRAAFGVAYARPNGAALASLSRAVRCAAATSMVDTMRRLRRFLLWLLSDGPEDKMRWRCWWL